ncbi:hypothetical protein OUZ56_025942 [Daphnia magna]|uniref:Uncharacterized protein n=1 Tax=Daphnia magna TaxID=35525 RepID=A0ABQ9ZKE2_9CRUS|nr:hypothetical protein OUZ56_025942 [Daphnia magna]
MVWRQRERILRVYAHMCQWPAVNVEYFVGGHLVLWDVPQRYFCMTLLDAPTLHQSVGPTEEKSATQFLLAGSSVGAIVAVDDGRTPSTVGEATESGDKVIRCETVCHLQVNRSSNQAGKENTVSFLMSPTYHHFEWSEVVGTYIRERRKIRLQPVFG